MRDANKINKLDLLLAKISIEEKSVGPRADRRSAESRNSRMLPLASDSQTSNDSDAAPIQNLADIFAAADAIEEVAMENQKASET